VAITITIHEASTEIILNAQDLHVDGGSLIGASDRIEVVKVVPDEEAERVTVELAEEASPGEWSLDLRFHAPLNPSLTGFYLSTFLDEEGTERRIATTHFEATDARRAFPCWDEPDLKAVFGLTLVVPEAMTALSNGPEVAREPLPDGRVEVLFADTMPMSTYLVAYVVGPLVLSETRGGSGVPTRVACLAGREHLAPFALDCSDHALSWFADYYGIAYPGDKVDHVGLPDFAQGAMENLGCITYRETLLLTDPDTATQEEKLEVAETVAHELAHMWFGDLVTMRWWNGIWLNEAFATFMSMLCVDDYRPDWETWNMFARLRSIAFDVDSLSSTRPIEFPVHSPDDASGMFDTLTYTKGAAVLRMLERYLGGEGFRDGIRRYLREHSYGNTETHDLWDALEAETGEPVRRIMDAWIFQGGYPEVAVTRDGDVLRFSQRRFLQSGEDDGTRWPIPMMVRQVAGSEEREERVLVEAEGAELPLLAPDALVVANAGGHSFVRVTYDDELRRRLRSKAMDLLAPLERYQLVDDAWAAVQSGRGNAASFLELVDGFVEETDLRVWQAILTGLAWFDRFVDGGARDRFHDRVRGLVRPALERLGWESSSDESDLTRSLRGQLLQSLAITGDDPEAKAHARELVGSTAGEDPQLVSAAVEIVAATGGPADYQTYLERYRAAGAPQEEQRYLFAIPRFDDADLVDRSLVWSLGEDVRKGDTPFVLGRAMTLRDNGPRAWRFVADHWDRLNEHLAASNVITLARALPYLTQPDVVDEVQTFFEGHDIPQSRLQLRQSLERQRVTSAMRTRVAPELAELFGERG
jgi:puromycin-sensitive aminopeptidase